MCGLHISFWSSIRLETAHYLYINVYPAMVKKTFWAFEMMQDINVYNGDIFKNSLLTSVPERAVYL